MDTKSQPSLNELVSKWLLETKYTVPQIRSVINSTHAFNWFKHWFFQNNGSGVVGISHSQFNQELKIQLGIIKSVIPESVIDNSTKEVERDEDHQIEEITEDSIVEDIDTPEIISGSIPQVEDIEKEIENKESAFQSLLEKFNLK